MRNKRDAGIASDVHFSWSQVRSTFMDWKVYIYASIFLTSCIPVYGLSMFMPSIVKGMGYESVTAQVSGKLYLCSAILLITTQVNENAQIRIRIVY